MSDDWIKVRKKLPDDPNVRAIARECEISVAETFLVLFRLWSWADTHSVDGKDLTIQPQEIDEMFGVRNLSHALARTNWLSVENGHIVIPNFDVHLSQSAKRRAIESKRKAVYRKKKTGSRASAKCPTKSRTKSALEKEKDRDTNVSLSGQDIYQAYPRKVGKTNALAAIQKALAKISELPEPPADSTAWLLERVQKFASSPAGQRGKFTPHPATWFNGGRYEDDEADWFRGEEHTGSATRISAVSGKYDDSGTVLNPAENA